MTNTIGIVTKIYEPTITENGTLVQAIGIKKQITDNNTIYLQVHHKINILNDIEVNDEVLVSYETFGKEKISEKGIIHFITLVIKKINKL